MRKKVLFCFLLFISASTWSQGVYLFKELDKAIQDEWYFNNRKEERIDSLKHIVNELKFIKHQKVKQYSLLREVADEYSAYIFDSAMLYYRRSVKLAYEIEDTKAIAESQSDFGHLLVSVGYYKEAIDTLKKVNVKHLKGQQLQDHFSYLVRAFYDNADYINDDFYSKQYRIQASAYVDSVLKYQVPNTVQPVITKALRFLAQWKPDSARHYYTIAQKNMKLTLHQQAIVHSCLGYIDITENRNIEGKEHLIRSAIADIKTSTKEALSLMVLARYLYEQGNIDRAYTYILKAKEDADFFGSKQRQLQVAEILPKIEGAKLLLEEKKKKKALRYIWVVSALTLVVILFLVIVYRQLFNIRKIWSVLKRNNNELISLNGRLKEANKIKENYIAHFFNTGSMYINKLEDISASMNNMLVSNNPQKLRSALNKINPKKEREQLFHNFDEVFLKLFPTFIKDVEALMRPDENYVLKTGQLLNTELRILALIRLGVKDNETMSQVLGVSINTIYTYKTKAKNRSIYSFDEFFAKLNSVKSV